MKLLAAAALLGLASAALAEAPGTGNTRTGSTPAWAREVVWYQIFPERFRNGDPKNDPTRESLEFPIEPSPKWKITPWTADWYERADWEKECGTDFYKDGVFNRRLGGDLQGVIDKLDYLADLGITAIYFNPLFQSRSLHKYDGNSYHHIDPFFGPDPKGDLTLIATETADPKTWKWTAADKLFLELLKKAKAKGMRVIIDGVFNHTGRDFFAFKDIREKQAASVYKDWYKIKEFDDPATRRNEFDYEGWWGHKTLPVFANTPDGKDMHPGPKAYVFDATRRWMKPVVDGVAQPGVDGWRLDVAEEKPAKFWADWNTFVLSLNPEAYTVAEIWKDAVRYIDENRFSAPMNYYAFAIPIRGWLIDNHPSVPPSRFMQLLDERRNAFRRANQEVMQNLLDSHDTERLPTMIVNAALAKYDKPGEIPFNVGNNTPRDTPAYNIQKPSERDWRIVRMCVLLQMTYVGAPMIYYGAEAGMWGGHDPDNRAPMVWADLVHAPGKADPLNRPRKQDEIKFDPAMFSYYKNGIALRKSHEVLRTGDYIALGAWDPQNSAAFVRRDGKSSLAIVLNRHESAAQTLTIDLPAGEAARFAKPRVLFVTSGTASEVSVEQKDGKLVVRLPALTGAVIEGS